MQCLTLPFPTREFLTKNNMTVVPTHPTFLFPQLEIDLKGCHFDIPEVVKAESQVVLNTTSRIHLKKMTENAGNRTHMRKGTTSRVMAAGPKLVFDQMAAPVPEIMDTMPCCS
jgi:hypothetical protein